MRNKMSYFRQFWVEERPRHSETVTDEKWYTSIVARVG